MTFPLICSDNSLSSWIHESLTKGNKLTKKEIKNIPYEEKKWGIYRDIVIEPLSEDMQKSYLDGVEKGFFESWRHIRDGNLLGNDE